MAADPTDDEIYASKYLHGFCEPSLPPHEVMVEIGGPVKLLKESNPPNLRFENVFASHCGKHGS